MIREAMFDELDRRVAASGDGNLSWELTERFSSFLVEATGSKAGGHFGPRVHPLRRRHAASGRNSSPSTGASALPGETGMWGPRPSARESPAALHPRGIPSGRPVQVISYYNH